MSVRKAPVPIYHEVPFELEERLIVVRARLAGFDQSLFMIVDTGASHMCLTTGLLPEKGRRKKGQGAGGGFQSTGADLAWLALGTAKVQDLHARVFDLAAVFARFKKHKIQGIVGQPFLRRFETTINYRTRTLLLKRL